MPSWSYYDGGWRAYDPETAALIEEHFLNAASTHVDLSLGPHREYRVDFGRMQQTNLHSNFQRPVSRSATDGAGERWEWQENDGSWQDFNRFAQGQLSAAKRAGRTGTTLYITSRHEAHPYEVRLAPDGTGTQTNVRARA